MTLSSRHPAAKMSPGLHCSGEDAEAVRMVTGGAQAVHQAVEIRQAALPAGCGMGVPTMKSCLAYI